MLNLPHFDPRSNPSAAACDWCEGAGVIPCGDGETSPCPECDPYLRGQDSTLARRALARERQAGLYHVRAMVAALDAARGMAACYLVDHADGCRCPACRRLEAPAQLLEAVRVLKALTSTVSEMVVSASSILYQSGGADSYGDDLREAARFMDTADELYDAEDAAAEVADEPTVVGPAGSTMGPARVGA